MAIIKCVECGAEISDKATACPKCGFPMPAQTNAAQEPANLRDLEFRGSVKPRAPRSRSGLYALSVLAILGVAWAAMTHPATVRSLLGNESDSSAAASQQPSVAVDANSSNQESEPMNNTPDQPEETTEVDTPAPAPAVAEIANAEPKQTADVADDPKSAINGTWCGTQNIQHFEGDENTVAYRYEVKDGMLQTYRMNVGASWARTSCSSSDSCVDGRDSEWQEIGICPVEYKEGRFSDTGTKYIEVFCEDKMPFDTVVLDLVSGDIGLRHATKPIDLKPCSSFE